MKTVTVDNFILLDSCRGIKKAHDMFASTVGYTSSIVIVVLLAF